MSKCYNQGQKRITLCLAPEWGEFRKALTGALVQAKFVKRQGRAPATFMERELQEWLEGLHCALCMLALLRSAPRTPAYAPKASLLQDTLKVYARVLASNRALLQGRGFDLPRLTHQLQCGLP